jgi:hypothetical protein
MGCLLALCPDENRLIEEEHFNALLLPEPTFTSTPPHYSDNGTIPLFAPVDDSPAILLSDS